MMITMHDDDDHVHDVHMYIYGLPVKKLMYDFKVINDGQCILKFNHN